jgi:hypothetical protein
MTTNNNTETKTPTKMSYNPLNNTLQTLEIKDKTIENYFNQIKTNFYSAVKAHYLIARDLFDAKENLNNEDYSELVKQCGFSGSTQRKYLSIGGDVRLMSLFIVGKLPMKWTTQYLLTQLDDSQFKKVAKVIDPDTSANKIREVAEMTEDEKDKVENDLLSFLQVEVDKTEVNVTKFKTLVNKIKSALSSIPEININYEKVESVESKILSYENKLKKEEEKKNQQIAKENMARAIFAKAEATATA